MKSRLQASIATALAPSLPASDTTAFSSESILSLEGRLDYYHYQLEEEIASLEALEAIEVVLGHEPDAEWVASTEARLDIWALEEGVTLTQEALSGKVAQLAKATWEAIKKLWKKIKDAITQLYRRFANRFDERKKTLAEYESLFKKSKSEPLELSLTRSKITNFEAAKLYPQKLTDDDLKKLSGFTEVVVKVFSKSFDWSLFKENHRSEYIVESTKLIGDLWKHLGSRGYTRTPHVVAISPTEAVPTDAGLAEAVRHTARLLGAGVVRTTDDGTFKPKDYSTTELSQHAKEWLRVCWDAEEANKKSERFFEAQKKQIDRAIENASQNAQYVDHLTDNAVTSGNYQSLKPIGYALMAFMDRLQVLESKINSVNLEVLSQAEEILKKAANHLNSTAQAA